MPIGMMECWNIGIMGSAGQPARKSPKPFVSELGLWTGNHIVLLASSPALDPTVQYSNIPLFHSAIFKTDNTSGRIVSIKRIFFGLLGKITIDKRKILPYLTRFQINGTSTQSLIRLAALRCGIFIWQKAPRFEPIEGHRENSEKG
jgi:hypothetical protein